jgi:hypothetical protein
LNNNLSTVVLTQNILCNIIPRINNEINVIIKMFKNGELILITYLNSKANNKAAIIVNKTSTIAILKIL